MYKVLVVDDDRNILESLQQILAEQGHDVSTAASGEDALTALQRRRQDLVLMDIRLPGINGLETFRRIRQADRRLPVIIMTGYATTDIAIEATKLGAFDYQIKPLEPAGILASVENALECVRLMRDRVALDGGDGSSLVGASQTDLLVGQTKVMQQVYQAIGRVASTDATVLIRGETGVGKELVARALYQHSLRAQAPLVVVNCAAIPETLIESELFGHERGAFTGAEYKRVGRFEQAHDGTVFLDEIGDMPMAIQAKLLRVLQEGIFERVGSNETIRVNLRVIAATNRDLEKAIASGHFREDLYHRLKVFTISLPPLRERKEDIPRLATHFLHAYARELDIEPPVLSPGALDVLRAHSWPGNVRELQHCIQRAIILTGGYPLQSENIRRALGDDAAKPLATVFSSHEEQLRSLVREVLSLHGGPATHSDFLEMAERLLISEALRLSRGNQTHTARRLGLSRPTLKAKMDKYALGRDTTPPEPPATPPV